MSPAPPTPLAAHSMLQTFTAVVTASIIKKTPRDLLSFILYRHARGIEPRQVLSSCLPSGGAFSRLHKFTAAVTASVLTRCPRDRGAFIINRSRPDYRPCCHEPCHVPCCSSGSYTSNTVHDPYIAKHNQGA